MLDILKLDCFAFAVFDSERALVTKYIWRGNKMASKRCKLDHSNEHNEIQHEKDRNAEAPQSETLIYIIPKKIPKARLQVLSNLARKKEFPVTEHYRLVNGAGKYHSFIH